MESGRVDLYLESHVYTVDTAVAVLITKTETRDNIYMTISIVSVIQLTCMSIDPLQQITLFC